jgi:AcrR family transcriptional regulator
MSRASRPRRLSRAESKDLTRRRLLEAARRVFLRLGFHATTVDMVAEEAGFTKGAVYSTFASKAELFLALYAQRSEERAAEVEAIGAGAEREIGRAWADVLRTERAWLLVLFEFWIHVARDEPLRRRFAAISARLRGRFAEAVERGARETGRTLPLDPELLATCHMALGNGIALESFRDPRLAAGDLYEQAALALTRGLAMHDEEPRERRRAAR